MQWFYVKNGERVGPVSESDFQGAFQRGDITEETLVWNKTLTDWVAYKDLPEPVAAEESAEREKPVEQTCSLCHQTFNTEELITFEGKRICASCKPFMVQNLRENAELHISTELRYAGFWLRVLASLIDGILWFAITLPIVLIWAFSSHRVYQTDASNSGLIFFMQFVIVALYEIIMTKTKGATLGKLAVGIKVVRPDGSPITWGIAIGRYYAKAIANIINLINALLLHLPDPIISFITGLYNLIAFGMAGIDSEKRALHDRMCNTRVIKKR